MKNQNPTISLLLFLLLASKSLLLTHSQLLELPVVHEDDDEDADHQVYIVHVDDPEDEADLLSSTERKEWHQSFLPNTTLDSGEPRLIYSYRHAIGGFSAWLTRDEARALNSTEGVLHVVRSGFSYGQTTYTPEFLGLNQWNSMWYDTYQGEGMIIGVIDTGIIPTHPSFRDDGLPLPPLKWRGRCDFSAAVCAGNNKLIGAMAFRSNRHPSPLDDHGHGTHTAGTAAGAFVYGAEVLGNAVGTASGTAPRAHVAAYKVLYNNRGTDYDFLAGIDQAILDGVDVLSMSLGSLKPQPMFSSANGIGTFSAIKKGIFPSICAMNNGPFERTVINDFPWVLTVGASTHDRRITAIVKLGNGMEFDGESAYQPPSHVPVQLPLVYPGVNKTQQTLNCLKGSMNGFDVKGKIVLCGMGHVENVEKSNVVKDAGGAGMILMNQPWNGFTTFADAHAIPTAHVSFVDALKILNYFETTPGATAEIIFKGTTFGHRPVPSVAFFSGRGPSSYNGGIIKPDILGPGVNILAAWPYEVGPNPSGVKTSTFNFESGTSMATPHLSGIAAMLKKNHPTWSPAAIKSAIMTTAHVADRDGNQIIDQADYKPAKLTAMGAGHVNPAAANDPGLVYDLKPDDYIPYLCGLGYSDNLVQAITRTRVQCSIIPKISPEQLNYPSIAFSFGNYISKIVTRTVTNVGEANEIYFPKIVVPKGTNVVVSPNKLEFSGVGQKLSFNVMFSVVGSQSQHQVAEGVIAWVSNRHLVKSPISVTF
ncbi:subtilisin-like protease 4 [Typha latifolia]|uniref:subtilisin-like protease 4 n=1 Tax=Typha latifolia TaxID=4733 RepID=UPI003C2BCFE8